MLECYRCPLLGREAETPRDRLVIEHTERGSSAARPGGLLDLAEAFPDLLLVLRLGQFLLGDLNQLGRDCGLDEALDEAHEFSKVKVGQ